MEHGRNTARNKKQLPKEPKHRLIRTFQSKSEKQPPKESKHGLVRTFQSNPKYLQANTFGCDMLGRLYQDDDFPMSSLLHLQVVGGSGFWATEKGLFTPF